MKTSTGADSAPVLVLGLFARLGLICALIFFCVETAKHNGIIRSHNDALLCDLAMKEARLRRIVQWPTADLGTFADAMSACGRVER
jgi:hypothetical protein